MEETKATTKENNGNVTQFPNSVAGVGGSENKDADASLPTESKEKAEQKEEFDQKSYMGMIKRMGEMVKILEQTWKSTQIEFKINDGHMKELYKFNEDNKTPMPETLTKEEKDDWDHFDGIEKITEEKVIEIFGKDHPVIGVQHQQTVDRLKMIVDEFFSYLSAMKEYRNVHDAYLMLVEEEEMKQIKKLEEIAANEQDPEKKATMIASIETYYDRKYIRFLKEPLDEKTINTLVNAFSDKDKISYWLNRAQDKLKQLGISSKFILEISQLEKRFLPEKYHKLSNMILLYIIRFITYTDCTKQSADADAKNKIVSIVMALDKYIQQRWNPEEAAGITGTLTTFLDQFIDKVNYDTAVVNEYGTADQKEADKTPTQEAPEEDTQQE